MDSRRGIIMRPPSLPLWDNIEIVKYFEEKFNIKTYLQNDANACAVAEWKFGSGKGAEKMIFLTFGTGFGAGLILKGKLCSGINDNAGETLAGTLAGSLRAISLTSHLSLSTAFSNDTEPSVVFAQQLYGLCDSGDVLIAISTSGNSENCVLAAITAKCMGG